MTAVWRDRARIRQPVARQWEQKNRRPFLAHQSGRGILETVIFQRSKPNQPIVKASRVLPLPSCGACRTVANEETETRGMSEQLKRISSRPLQPSFSSARRAQACSEPRPRHFR
eukprot:6527890-Pyramimonas_sp.AAC.1